jgi:2-C-methyl-D-erythritol 4-phosphate cytidylyltransferase/2-C-methyl-D-erythritol 2,4-cyclodiphosphate synthase
MLNNVKVGSGFDAHRFDSEASDQNFIMLGGIKIPHQYRLLAHSDGDVLLHALTDALLGAIGAGDIGLHFPPTDSKWRNEDSAKFIIFANELIKKEKGVISNVDLTVICESPRLSPFRDQMQERVAEILGLNTKDVTIKGTTTEKMGFTGRKEGVACQAVVCVLF